tara:strand:- start:266 stop:976 length:711 start_codon:yes stop_codon:yes gene_type:complete
MPFEYSSLAKTTQSELRTITERAHTLIQESQIKFIHDMGCILSDAKKKIGDTSLFVQWAEFEFEISKRTAINYVYAYERLLSDGWEECNKLSPSAIYRITRKKLPADSNIISRVRDGEVFTASEVDSLLLPHNGNVQHAAQQTVATTPQPEPELVIDHEQESAADVSEINASINVSIDKPAAMLAEDALKKHVGPLARLLTRLSEANGGEGMHYSRADGALNVIIESLEAMKEGEK